MQTSNAIKRLKSAGFEVNVEGARVIATKRLSTIDFIDHYGEAIAIGWDGVACDSLAQAVTLAA